jgi:hypothetical protein
MQDIHRVFHTLRFFGIVAGCVRQFAYTHGDCGLRCSNAIRQPIEVRLANRGVVEVFPRARIQTIARWAVHVFHFLVSSGVTIRAVLICSQRSVNCIDIASKATVNPYRVYCIQCNTVIPSLSKFSPYFRRRLTSSAWWRSSLCPDASAIRDGNL